MNNITIDCNYLGLPNYAAAYLLIHKNEAIFIDNNTTHAVPILLKSLRDAGLKPEQVTAIIITHVHLDHAGGTWDLFAACPNARVIAHPRAAKHLIDSSKLLAAVKQVYGTQECERMYGKLGAIPKAKVHEAIDNEIFDWQGKTLRFIHTKGHANHHMCIHDESSQTIYTGDSFGLRYPALQNSSMFIFASSSPTDFHPEEAKKSLDIILETQAKIAYLTHFGAVTDLRTAAAELYAYLDFSANLMERAKEKKDDRAARHLWLRAELIQYFQTSAAKKDLQLSPKMLELLELDIELNAQGIAFAADK